MSGSMRICVVATVAAALAGVAHAQTPPTGGVAQSGMEQGEAVVAVRSDVRLSIKGIRATLSDRLAAMTREVTTQMPAVRECYTKLVATRPATVGGMRAVVVLEPGRGAPSLELSEVDGSDEQLSACVGKVLRKLAFRDVERPAAAEITLAFDNSRARGQAQLEERRAEFVAAVEAAPDGASVGRWQTDAGEIAFEVRVEGAAGAQVAQAAVQGIRAGFSGFLDCRRRAGRKGMNPAGELELSLRMTRDGSVQGQVQRAEIQDQQRTPGCVEKAMERVRVQGLARPAQAVVTVRFAS